jgi:hypothetical protein
LSALSNNAKTGRGPRLAPRPPSESDNIYYSEEDLSSNFRDRRLVAVAPVREPGQRGTLCGTLRLRSGQALKSCPFTKKTAGPRSTPPRFTLEVAQGRLSTPLRSGRDDKSFAEGRGPSTYAYRAARDAPFARDDKSHVAMRARSLASLVKARGFGMTGFGVLAEGRGPSTTRNLARAQDQASLGMTGCGQWSV